MRSRLLAPFLLILLLWGCSTPNPVLEKIEEAQQETVEQPLPLGPSVSEQEPSVKDTARKPDNGMEDLTVHYMDVGQADAALLTFSDEEGEYNILVDAGNWNADDVVSYLKGQLIDHLDIVIGTHPHADHIGQIDKVIEQIGVDEVWMSGDAANSQVFNQMLDAIDKYDVDYYEPRAGEVFDVGPMVIEVFNPSEVNGNVNEGSLSMKMTYGDVSFLFTGDAEAVTERKMIDSGYNLKADFLQLGHHGSRTSTSLPFLEAVDPEVAIISAGENSQYGHPHAEVVERVKAHGTEIFETSVHGSIVVRTDGETYKIGTVKDGEVESEQPADSKPDVQDVSAAPSPDCIDLNQASLEELQNIMHIGPERAKDLVELRPFERVEDLDKIEGIGPARVAEILAEGAACTGG